MTYKTFDIVVVPFPFTDSKQSKRRPALIVSSAQSFNDDAEHSIMVMVTTAIKEMWPLDVPIKDLKSAGLSKPSAVRMKFFTLDNRLIIRKVGQLSIKDKTIFCDQFQELFQEVLK